MTNEQALERVIQWINQLTGITTIKSHQSGDRPDLPYNMVEIVGQEELTQRHSHINYEELDTVNSAGHNELKASPNIEVEWTFLVFSYGDGGMDTLKKISTSRQLSQKQEPLNPDLIISETGRINSVPELINKSWEKRAQMNLFVRGMSSDGYVIDVIEEHSPFDVATMERT